MIESNEDLPDKLIDNLFRNTTENQQEKANNI